MAQNDAFRVLIIGGGSCGLAIANGLQKAGIACTLFERDSADDYWNKTRDWGMLLHWGKAFLMKTLPENLQARFKEMKTDPDYPGDKGIPHVNGATGEILGAITMPDMVRVSRKKFRKLLTSNGDLNISFKKRVVAIESGGSTAKVTFDDGTVESGNLVVGADGSRSKVRQFLVGEEEGKPTDTGMTMINFAATGYTAEQAPLMRKYHPVATCGYDPEVHGIFLMTTLDVSEPHKPETWSFQLQHAWWGPPYTKDLTDPKDRLQFFKKRYGALCEPFSVAALSLPDATVLPVDPCQQWSPIPWDNHEGTVTLVGDAAHSMLPNRGQGLNNAMQDAADIVDAVKLAISGKATLKEAITRFEESMRPRGARDVALSLESAKKTRISDLMESPMFQIGLQKMETQGVVAVEKAIHIAS